MKGNEQANPIASFLGLRIPHGDRFPFGGCLTEPWRCGLGQGSSPPSRRPCRYRAPSQSSSATKLRCAEKTRFASFPDESRTSTKLLFVDYDYPKVDKKASVSFSQKPGDSRQATMAGRQPPFPKKTHGEGLPMEAKDLSLLQVEGCEVLWLANLAQLSHQKLTCPDLLTSLGPLGNWDSSGWRCLFMVCLG